MNEHKIPALVRKLGLLENAEPLVREALTHRTYAVEHHLNYDNQRLEFLGDAVLEIIQTEYLYFRYPQLSEGDLTKIRSALSCESTLAAMARQQDLGNYLLIGNGEKECGGYDRDSTLCDLFEAVIGALYLACGMENARTFVHNIFDKKFDDPKDLLNTLNPKGRLQEFSQGRWRCTPEYTLFRSGGLQHQPFFEVEVQVGNFRAIGRGNSRKNAEISAAVKLVKFFTKKYNVKGK
jgi:ribonuclease-3